MKFHNYVHTSENSKCLRLLQVKERVRLVSRLQESTSCASTTARSRPVVNEAPKIDQRPQLGPRKRLVAKSSSITTSTCLCSKFPAILTARKEPPHQEPPSHGNSNPLQRTRKSSTRHRARCTAAPAEPKSLQVTSVKH